MQVLAWMFLAGAAWAHDLGPGDGLISPFYGCIEPDSYMIPFDVIPARQVAGDLGHFRPDLWTDMDYVAFPRQEKATGHERTTMIPLDRGFVPQFNAFEEWEYRDKRALFVILHRVTPRYGGMLGLWVTTYMFAADTLEVLAEMDGAASDVTRADAGNVPEVPSLMRARFLVSCVPVGRDRRFSLGLIDRKALYGPYWCGPQQGAARCGPDSTASCGAPTLARHILKIQRVSAQTLEWVENCLPNRYNHINKNQ